MKKKDPAKRKLTTKEIVELFEKAGFKTKTDRIGQSFVWPSMNLNHRIDKPEDPGDQEASAGDKTEK